MRFSPSLATLFLSLTMVTACSSDGSTPKTPLTGSTGTAWVWDGGIVSGMHEVTIETSKGTLTLELDATNAPKTVTNFMALAASGYYDNLTFHRVIPGFMIQGGDPSGNGTGGKSVFGEMFEDEINPASALYSVGYKAGVIAMANRGPNTNGSQFFIMEKDYPLPPNYTIFGHITKGQEIVTAIANVPRDSNDMPKDKVTFTVKVVK